MLRQQVQSVLNVQAAALTNNDMLSGTEGPPRSSRKQVQVPQWLQQLCGLDRAADLSIGWLQMVRSSMTVF